jgi:hypothetical protein
MPHEVRVLSKEPQGNSAGRSLGINRQVGESARRKKILYGIPQLPLMKCRADLKRKPRLQLGAGKRLACRFKTDTGDREPFVLMRFSNRKCISILKPRAGYRKQQQRRYGC